MNYKNSQIRSVVHTIILDNDRRRNAARTAEEVDPVRVERNIMHNSQFTGMNWVQELINGHPTRIKNNLRMSSDVFQRLCAVLNQEYGLRDTTRFSHVESVAIFLYIIAHGVGYRNAAERFQHSLDTIHKKFQQVLDALIPFTCNEIRPNLDGNICGHIRNNDMYFPHFQNCIGGIDGTHITACIRQTEGNRFRNRKGNNTQNVLGVCDFDMLFTFVSTGWEGSMHDARILGSILADPVGYSFPVAPAGKYYLVDSGYTNMKGFLAPYKGERYHLPDFRRNDPRNANEMFNRHHASLRSVIERTFGAWKKRFRILDTMPQYLIDKQSGIVATTMAIHNFIRRNSGSIEEFLDEQQLPQSGDYVEASTPTTEASTSTSTSNHDITPVVQTQQMRGDSYMAAIRDDIRRSICYE